jgi:hypothetical protein
VKLYEIAYCVPFVSAYNAQRLKEPVRVLGGVARMGLARQAQGARRRRCGALHLPARSQERGPSQYSDRPLRAIAPKLK